MVGRVNWRQGKLAEAESNVIKALSLDRKLLGNEHPEIAVHLNNLAEIVFGLGRALYHRALKEAHLGDSQTARSLNQ